MEDVGRELRTLRERAGISQGELARRIRRSRFTVNKYESGETVPPVETLAKICEILGSVTLVIGGQRIEVGFANIPRNPRTVPKQLRLRLGIICATSQATIIVPSARGGKRLDVEVLSA
ncbi:MAG: helix-turn-helix transcriptional regulator [Candidatus Acidiferrales bacterium]